jgi:pimeloyl-ACP methyl ester carboxylesterase
MPSDYHVILLDMPGHGESTFIHGHDDPSIQSFVRSIKEFFELTKLDTTKVYLIGSSFGGT